MSVSTYLISPYTRTLSLISYLNVDATVTRSCLGVKFSKSSPKNTVSNRSVKLPNAKLFVRSRETWSTGEPSGLKVIRGPPPNGFKTVVLLINSEPTKGTVSLSATPSSSAVSSGLITVPNALAC